MKEKAEKMKQIGRRWKKIAKMMENDEISENNKRKWSQMSEIDEKIIENLEIGGK